VRSISVSTAYVIALLLASTRAAAWLLVAPPFGTRSIPAQVKALLAVAIVLPVTPRLVDQIPELTTGALLTAAVEQVAVGVALGFLTALIFAAVQAAGELIDLFGGFAVAFAFDPLAFTGNSLFGRFYNLFTVTLLFATDAYLLVLRGFLQTYQAVPLDGTVSFSKFGAAVTSGLGHMFLAALQIAGPLIGVLFLADVGLGLLSRVAPALNAFAMGFPVKILLTLSLVGISIALLPQSVESLAEQAVRAIMGVTGS
jgi:flagellar biosynthetic protein FliR